jgi:hypothetical protein
MGLMLLTGKVLLVHLEMVAGIIDLGSICNGSLPITKHVPDLRYQLQQAHAQQQTHRSTSTTSLLLLLSTPLNLS